MQCNDYQEIDYLERYVNDGSPSGFTRPGQMSVETDPFGEHQSFYPYRVYHKNGLSLELYRSSHLLSLPLRADFLIHPDMKDQWLARGCILAKAEDVAVVPTSSGRTVRVCDDNRSYFLKFDYNKTLGRVNRAITRIKALAGLEINDELFIAASNFPGGSIAFLPEYAALLARPLNAETEEWAGLVYRDGTPISFGANKPERLIPLFSFWSIDRNTSSKNYVFEKIFRSDAKKYATALQFTASTLVDFYFFLLITRGLQMEFNAQNVLVGLDINTEVCCVVIRDFSSTEKIFH
jgi:hypothetical protein